MEFIFKQRYIIIIIFIFLSNTSFAQLDSSKNVKPFFSEKGFLIGYGHGLSHSDIPEGNYRVVLLMGHFAVNPFKKKEDNFPGMLNIFFEPQINPVKVLNAFHNAWEIEFGLNAGIQHTYHLYKNIYVYELISSGPHFISVHTGYQARGFIFSDNMGTGIYLFTGKTTAINLGFRIRHLSNANTEIPNHGINTYNFYFGISHILRH
jgi:hypothetical protein